MTREQILAILQNATGNPNAGAVAEILPTLADALDAELNPNTENRVTRPKETR